MGEGLCKAGGAKVKFPGCMKIETYRLAQSGLNP